MMRTFDIKGQTVPCIETDEGRRLWLCYSPVFRKRAEPRTAGFYAHTALAIWRCIDDGSIEIR